MWWQEIGPPGPEHTIIFNGDFIDRGAYGLEVLMILLAFKVAAPEAVHLNRGNHEDRMLATVYGFKNECVAKTNEHIWQRICGLFPLLPLGAVVEEVGFVVHGGLSSQVPKQSSPPRHDPDQPFTPAALPGTALTRGDPGGPAAEVGYSLPGGAEHR